MKRLILTGLLALCVGFTASPFTSWAAAPNPPAFRPSAQAENIIEWCIDGTTGVVSACTSGGNGGGGAVTAANASYAAGFSPDLGNSSTDTSATASVYGKLLKLLTLLPASLGQKTMAASLAVVLASDQSAIPVVQSGTWTVQPGNTANTTAWKVDGSAVTQPVSGTVTANAGTGTMAVAGSVASGGAPGSPVTIGARAATTLPGSVADTVVVNLMTDKFGRVVTAPQNPRELIGTQYTTTAITTTTETVVVAATAATFDDLVGIVVVNTSATATRVDFRDTNAGGAGTGTVIFSVYAPAGATTGFMPPIPIPQTTVNTNWTATLGTAVTDVRVFCQFTKNK